MAVPPPSSPRAAGPRRHSHTPHGPDAWTDAQHAAWTREERKRSTARRGPRAAPRTARSGAVAAASSTPTLAPRRHGRGRSGALAEAHGEVCSARVAARHGAGPVAAAAGRATGHAAPRPLRRGRGGHRQAQLQRSVRARLLDGARLLVERDLQRGVPDAVPLQVPAVVLLPVAGPLLQRVLHGDGHGLHLDAARLGGLGRRGARLGRGGLSHILRVLPACRQTKLSGSG